MARSRRKKRGKRPRGQGPPPAPAPRTVERRRRTARAERPVAPWGAFPLSEIAISISIVLIVAGIALGGLAGERSGLVTFGVGLVIGSAAGLEVAAREHFAGYRSHTLLLSGLAGLVTLVGLVALVPDDALVPSIAVALVVGALVAWGCVRAFRKASGGLAFRVGAPRR